MRLYERLYFGEKAKKNRVKILHAVREEKASGYYVLTFASNEKNLLDIIVRNNLLSLLVDQCIRFLREEDQSILPILDTPQLQADSFVLSGFVMMQVTLILQWHLQNYQPPVEEMIRTYQRLIYQPLIFRKGDN